MTRRLLLSYLTVTLIALLLLEVPLAVFYREREIDRLSANVERDATVMATIYEDALEDDSPLDPAPAESYTARTGARVVIVDENGTSLVDTGADTNRDLSTRPEVDAALAGDRSTGIRRSDTLDTDLLFVAVPVASGGVVHGALRLTLDAHEVNERVQRFWIALVGAGLLILVVMACVGFVIARSVSRPVRTLQAAADRFSSGDLTPDPIDERAPPELASLQRAMNNMATELDGLIERQRSFVADASHQLRTPLTALRLRLENLESETTTDSSERRELSAAIDETTRLSSLVEDLLQLARSEQSGNSVVIDLADVVRDRVDTWTATAEHEGVELMHRVASASLPVTALAGGIEQVLDNVIDNALRVSPPGGTVTVEAFAGPSTCTVVISDQGPGIDDAHKHDALTRFWRADTSTPGTGLGLAIAQRIMTASNGTIELSDVTPQGLAVTLSLPAISARTTEWV
ncbi:MAG: ATP-binding protein [Ilumatobacter sp.]|uniref:sensor histidine kinase n=1 Tax=Ilumatobacter sp. TaxID=1967498 RepID=UPI003918BED7